MNVARVKLELQRSRGPFGWLIWVMIAGLIGIYVILSNITGIAPFSHPFTVNIALDDAKGINPGSQVVRLAGVDVGVVTDERLIHDTPVVTLSIQRNVAPLYRDATFRVRPNTELDDLYVAIESRGHKSAGVIKQGEIIPAQQTETPIDISRVLDIFQPDTRQSMSVLLDELERGAPDNGARLQAAFIELAPFLQVADTTTRVIDQRRRLVANAMTNLTNLVNALGQRDRQLVQLIESGDASLAELARNDAPFAATIQALPPVMTEARSAFTTLRSTEDQLDPAIQSLEPAAANLSSGLTSLEALAHGANPALTALQPALAAVAPLAAQLRPTAADLSSTVQQLLPQAPKFNRITKLLPPCFSSISQFFNNTLSVFKYYDSFGSWPRGNNTTDSSSFGGTGTATLTQYTPCTGPLK